MIERVTMLPSPMLTNGPMRESVTTTFSPTLTCGPMMLFVSLADGAICTGGMIELPFRLALMRMFFCSR